MTGLKLQAQPNSAASSTVTTTATTPGSPTASTAASTSTAAPSIRPDRKRLVVAVSNRHALVYLPLGLAESQGLFAAEGIELEISEQSSSARAQAQVLSGAADIGCGWLESVLLSQLESRALLQAFVLQTRTPLMAIGVSPALASTGLAGLRGRKLGVAAVGSPMHTCAHAALVHSGARVGLRARDIGFVSVGSPASALAALKAGQVDALAYSDPIMTQWAQRGELRQLADLRSLEATLSSSGMELPSGCLYATPEWLQANAPTAQAVADAMLRALQWLMRANLSQLVRQVPELTASGIDLVTYVSSLEMARAAFSQDGMPNAASTHQLLEAMWLADPALRLGSMSAERAVNTGFVQRARQRIRL
jgi:NitT/TauT family transport system substrate-binding protein